MLNATDLHKLITLVLKECQQGVKDACVGGARITQITINGEIAYDGATTIAESTTTNVPIEDTVTTTTEAQTTQSQTSTDNVVQQVARGGEKIFERETESSED